MHLLTECKSRVTEEARTKVFGFPQIIREDLKRIKLPKIINFAKISGLHEIIHRSRHSFSAIKHSEDNATLLPKSARYLD